MTTPYFGYSSARKSDDPVATIGADWSKAGYVSTSEDADASVFPPNEPVRFTSTDPLYLSKLGTGYLAGAVIGLNQQLGGQGADICVVRVLEGTGATPAARLAATHANIIGSAGAQTGLYALRAAPDHVKMTPRLIDVPGYDVQQPDGVTVANPVVAALPEHLEALKAVAVINVAPGSKEAAIAARQTMSSERLIPLGVAGRAYRTINGASALVTVPLSSYILGLFIRGDNANGGKPFKPIANQAVQGLADISRPIRFSLTDGSTEGQLLLAQDVSVVVRGEGQVDSISDGGFVYIGVESASTDLAWTQFHQIRAYDYLDAKMTVLIRQFLGREITPRVAEAMLKSIGFMLEDHVNAEDILGYEIKFPKNLNSASEVGLGHLSIETRIQPAPVFRLASNTVRRYPAALEGLVNAIIARAGTQSAIIA